MVTDEKINNYVERLKDNVVCQIDDFFREIQHSELYNRYFEEKKFPKKFHNYYCSLVSKKREIEIREFVIQYSIQGVTSGYIEFIEKNKHIIINQLEEQKLTEVFYEYFYKQEKNKDKTSGSFFTKMVHTVHPDKYCQVDIQIKNYFKLNNESYFISMIVLSNAFNDWIDRNKEKLEKMKELLNEKNAELYQIKYVSNIRLLNMIFWKEANS